MRFVILVAVVLCLPASPTCAETIAHCGKSVGKEYTVGEKIGPMLMEALIRKQQSSKSGQTTTSFFATRLECDL